MEDPVKIADSNPLMSQVSNASADGAVRQAKPTAGSANLRAELRSGLNSKLRTSSTRQSPAAVPVTARRNSTGGLGQKQSVSAKTAHRKTTVNSVSDPLRRSLPEIKASKLPNASKGLSTANIRETTKLWTASSAARTLKTPASSSSSKNDSVNKPTFTRATSSSTNKVNVTSKKNSLPSIQPPSVTISLERSNKLSSPSARSPSTSPSSGMKKGNVAASRDQILSLSSGRKKVATPECRDFQLLTLPQVETKAGDDVRLDLRGQRIRNLNATGVSLSPNLEVLHLSFNNFKGPGFEPLGNCQVLQQLYLAGNRIASFSSLPELSNLEFLSVAQNKLKSLAMASQPRLQVLAASKNKIASLKGFLHLPVLEHLRVEENPILRMPHLEAASILLVGSTLKKFNDRDLSKEELASAMRYPAHTAICIRDGWELCSPDRAADSTFEFLVDCWKGYLPPGFQLKEASIDSPFEEDACRCHFIFLQEDDGNDSNLVLKYQWYVGEGALSSFKAIPDTISEVYCPKHDDVDKYLKVECSPVLGETEYPPIFAISSQVSPGTGCPKVLNLDVCGDLMEGNIIKGCAEVAWCGGTPGKGVSSWLRRKWNSSPVAISGAEDDEYQLTMDDVDSSLVFMYTPVTAEGTKGEPQYAVTDYVKAAPPSVSNIRIIGEFVEGNTIKGVGDYFGGQEGPSKYEWLRENKETRLIFIWSPYIYLRHDSPGI